MYTYPPAVTADGLTADEVHRLLKSPRLVAKRLADLLTGRYISDVLLKGRYIAEGGAVLYENGDPVDDHSLEPEAIAPGGEYPLGVVPGGDLEAAKTKKWGRDALVTDEAIARLRMDPVNRAFNQLVGQSVGFIDSAALGVIASKVTQAYDVTTGAGAWTTGAAIAEGVMVAKATAEETPTAKAYGYELDSIVLSPVQWAKVMARLVDAGYLPREARNPVTDGNWPQAFGLTWLASPNVPTSNPVLADTDNLGGMADENLGGPGYTKIAGVGVETKVIRDDDNDQYKPRARRVTVPVVTDPLAGIQLTNTGL